MTDLLDKAEIKQLNLGYDPDQDRLLLKVGLSDSTEVKVWFTRRLVKSLWPLLQGASDLHEVDTQEVVMVEHHGVGDLTQSQPAKQSLDAAHQTNLAALAEQPILAHSCSIVGSDEMQSVLKIQSKDGKTIKVVLNIELTLALSSMLQLATKEAAWDLSFSVSHFVISDTSTRPVLH